MVRADSEGNVYRPRIASWEQAAASRPHARRTTEGAGRQRRAEEGKRRSLEELIVVAQRFGVSESELLERIGEEPEEAGVTAGQWLRRAKYFASWPEIVSGRCLAVELVPMGDILDHAVRSPLRRWSLGLCYLSGARDDVARIFRHLPWIEDCEGRVQKGLIAHLKSHQIALLVCATEALARSLLAAAEPAYFLRLKLYSPGVETAEA